MAFRHHKSSERLGVEHVRFEGGPIPLKLLPPLLRGFHDTDVVTESESYLCVIWIWGFPYIQMRTLNFKELLRTENMLHFLGTGHLHDPEAEGVAIRIPQNLG